MIADLQDDKGDALAAEVGGGYSHTDVTNEAEVQAAVDSGDGSGTAASAGQLRRDRPACPHPESRREHRTISVISSRSWRSTSSEPSMSSVWRPAAMATTEPMADGLRGAIVNTASVAAFDGQIGQAAYSASKGGIVGMTLPIARDLSAVGIRVNTHRSRHHGHADAGGIARAGPRVSGSAGALFPKRLGTPEEFAEAAYFLLTHDYMNAETIRMDGGIRMAPK